MIDFIQDEKLLKPERAADFLGIGLPTLRSWVREFGIPQIVIRGRVRYKKSDLAALIEHHTQRPTIEKRG